MVDGGAAELVNDDKIDATITDLVSQLLDDRERIEEMQKAALAMARPDAAEDIAKQILETINKHPNENE